MTRKKVFSWILVAVVLGGWALFLRPVFLGGPASYVMVTGMSMEPRMHTDDLIVTRRDGGYRRGDIVAFRVPEGEPGAGATVIHRVVGGNGIDGYVTRGDNRELSDQWHPTDAEVEGRMLFLVPKAGAVIAFVRAPLGIALIAAVLVFLVIVLDKSSGSPAPSVRGSGPLQKLRHPRRSEAGADDPIADFYRTDPRATSELRHKL